MAESLLDDEAGQIVRKVIEKALEGDPAAQRLCLERLIPPRRERTVTFELPPISTAADAAKASSSVLAACADGSLTPGNATEIMALISSHVEIIESTEIEARLAALEKERQK